MRILLTDAGKRYNREWIFRHVNYEFLPGRTYAITGPNGSGKSTLLQVLSGAILTNEGKISFFRNHNELPAEMQFREVSVCAPYLEVIEEMSALEFLRFHFTFKPVLMGMEPKEIIRIIQLEHAADKQIRYYSSGMKQRVKLAQAIFSNVPAVLLDEPATNLDEEGIRLYKTLVENYCQNRLLIISSNDKKEYPFCEEFIDMLDYK